MAEDNYQDEIRRWKWELIIKNRVKDPERILNMENSVFFEYMQALKDFGGGEDNGKR